VGQHGAVSRGTAWKALVLIVVGQALLQARRDELLVVMRASAGQTLESKAFALRVLGSAAAGQVLGAEQSEFDLSATPEAMAYEGYPRLAYLGFGIGSADNPSTQAVQAFIAGLGCLRQRSEASLGAFIADDVAILGIADGIAGVARSSGHTTPDLEAAREWLKGIIDLSPAPAQWSARMRALAGDLLDGRGRLKVSPDKGEFDALALELVLRDTWPHAFSGVAFLERVMNIHNHVD